MKKYRPNRMGLNLIRIILIILCVAVVILSEYYLSGYKIIMYTVIGIFCGAAFVIGMILLPIVFAKTQYNISVNEISKISGFFFITRQYMHGRSIQYVTTITTPFSRFTGFNFIIINALGGQVFLLFLSKDDAMEITATLNRSIRLHDKLDKEKEELSESSSQRK